jgi:hypothetical protein
MAAVVAKRNCASELETIASEFGLGVTVVLFFLKTIEAQLELILNSA